MSSRRDPDRTTTAAHWWAQLAVLCAWSALALAVMVLDPSEAQRSLGYKLAYALVWSGTGVCVTSALWLAAKRFGILTQHPSRVLAAVAVASAAGSVAWTLIPGIIEDLTFPQPSTAPVKAEDVLSTLVFCGILLLAWQAIAVASHHMQATRSARERALAAEALAREARLDVLRAQLSPHFLFNALNSVVALIPERPADAQRVLTDLSALLRRALARGGELATLREELQFVEMLVQVQLARFESDLDVEMNVEPGALDYPFPSLLLQPLVENAIKHGMNTCAPPLSVKLSARRAGAKLVLRVSNTGSLRTETAPPLGESGAGVGLRNVRERLTELYPDRHSFSLRESEGWVHAELELEAA